MKAWFALAASLAANILLFSFLPAMGYLHQHFGTEGKTNALETKLVSSPVMPKKKEKPREREEQQTTQKKAPEPGKSVGRQRFVMDLGPGGGGTGANAAAISQGDLQQASYAEGETDVDARVISQSAPQRPKKAVAAGAGGMVRCLLTIGEDGRVAHVQFFEVPSGDYGFEEAVREAVSSWRYQPATVGGVPVRQRIEQPFRF